MKLWVRSQDRKKLIQINNINVIFGNIVNIIIKTMYEGTSITLGNYYTVDRALEVLDEIQDLLNDISDDKIVGCVYEMPKE